MRKGKGILKRSAAAVLSAAMVFSMNFSVLPVVAHAQGSQDPGGTGARQNEFQEVKIGLDEIASMAAKTLGPSGDGDTLEASFDGDTATYTNSNYTDPSNSKPQVYTFTFEEQVNLCKVRIHPRNAGGGVGNGAPNSCLVEVSTDGSGYTQAAEQAVTDTSLTWTDISFTAVPAKSVRLTLNSAHETVVSTGEVELYKLTENPGQPDPADKTGLKEAIDRVTEKMAGLNEEDYVISSWDALEAALVNAQTVYENEGASADDVAAALSALEAAEKNLAELISPIYMTDFVSCENGRVTVELNGPTNYVPDGETKWTYEYRDGRHLLYTDNWDTAALAPGETKNYRSVCIYDMNGTDGEGTWSFVYLSDDGAGSVSTEYGNRPAATITAGGKTYDLGNDEDKTEIAGLKFTAAPVVHVSGVDLRGAESQRTGVGESSIDAGAVVSPDRTEMEFPIKSQTGKPASGNYSLYISWHGTTAYFWNIQINSVNVIDRSALEEAIAEAEALTADDYTEQSWAAMQEKLEAAREVLDDVIATTSEVSAASQELNDAVAALVDKVPPADKTELQQLYNEVKDTVFTYPNTTFCDRFTDALADAADVLENDTAIQEDVDSAYYYLEKYYWLNMVNDKVSYYNPDKSGQDGRFVYSDKITESILPLVTAFKAARYANVNTEPDILKGYYEGFTEAEKHEAEIADPDLRGVEVGFNAENDFDTETALNSNNYGHFEITGQEFVSDAAGNVSVKVFIRFVNDGISPVTGEEGDDYSVSEMTKARCRVAYEAPSQKGSKSISGKDKLNGSYGNGFIGEVTVPLDSVISLTVEDSVMPGFFKVQKFAEADKTELETAISAAEALDEENYTEESWAAVQEKLETAKNVLDNVLATQTEVDDAADALNNAMEALVPDTDKAALQKLYDEVKDAQFDYPAQSYYKGFTNALNRAGTVLEDEKAFQSEVDTAYNTLEKYYWLNMLNDKVAYYNPDKEGEDGRFIYSDKLTESILPVVAAFQEGSNVSSGASTEKILTCYNAFIDAEKLIQTAENDLRGTEVGFNADAMDPDNYGHFEITGQEFVVGEDGVVRVKVSFKFVNDGIDPISGEQGKPFSLSDMGDLSCRVAYESPSETGSKGVDYQGPLDGNIKNGIEGYFTVDQDSAVNLYFYRTAYMPGYYKVQKFEEADKTALEAAVSEAEALNKEDYLTDSWEVMEEKLEAAKAVLDNPLATDAEVADAAKALNDAVDALTVDKTALEEAMKTAEEAIGKEYIYQHDHTWNDFLAAYEHAEDVYENPDAEGEDVKKAAEDLISGYNELVFESEAPAAWFVIGNTQTAIEENALLNKAFDLKFTDNGRLLQFVLNGTEFRIDGTEDGAAFEEIQDVLNEGNGADGKNILIVRDCVPPAGGVYPTESTYTFYFDQTAPAAEVTYSTEEPTDGDVVVTIISNEPLDGNNLPEGWVLSTDGLTAVKTYQENTEETVAFTDGAGNVVTAEIRITNIDRTPQEPENPEDPESPEDPDSPKDPDRQNDPGKKPGQSDGTRTDGKSNSAEEERPSAVRTGDNTNPGVCVSVMAVSAAAAAVIIRKKKEEKH
ncbi:MAG TPA: FIVAR domain-containing protein [Candidatus Mediterraneibacter norwichensis]|nr:FIVAR domain-containing protein [Candidatus Mediterraneibacter norwichensis]